jgi:hypothetical protein
MRSAPYGGSAQHVDRGGNRELYFVAAVTKCAANSVQPVMDSLLEALRDVGVARARVPALVPRAKRAK